MTAMTRSEHCRECAYSEENYARTMCAHLF
nr:MAG TPA: hypothetical protein [Caudoviricetes sp.]